MCTVQLDLSCLKIGQVLDHESVLKVDPAYHQQDSGFKKVTFFNYNGKFLMRKELSKEQTGNSQK